MRGRGRGKGESKSEKTRLWDAVALERERKQGSTKGMQQGEGRTEGRKRGV